jgi:hypothetical protein
MARNQDYQPGWHHGRDEEDRRYGNYTESDEGDSSVRAGSYDEGRDRVGGRPDYRPNYHGGQFRHSSPGGFGQAQGSSAWRNHGVEEDSGPFRSGGWSDPYGEGRRYPGTGPHRGKGPRGYQRSDDRLKEMLCERLRDDPNIDATDVSVNVESGRVVFEGTVDSRRTRHLIEDVADQFGVDDVQNNLRVIRSGPGMRPGH